MADNDRPNTDEKPEAEAERGQQAFLDLLEDSGFFQQINSLEENLKVIGDEMKAFGDKTAIRMEETENMAADVLAIESILAVMLKAYPISADELDGEIKDRTAAFSGKPDGSPTVRALAQDILKKSKG